MSFDPITSFLGPIPLRTFRPAGDRPGGAVLFFHGLRASAETHDREARALAAAGLTAILPDAPHHGRRRSGLLDAMPNALAPEGYGTFLRLLCEARDEVPRLVDHARALGHTRVAIAGISMGAYVALAAGAREPRIDAIVSILGSPDWTPEFEIPVDDAALLAQSPHHEPERFPPRPLLLLNGGRDANVRPGPARDLATRLRALYGNADLVHREYPDADHFPSEADWADLWATAVSFLVRSVGDGR